MRVGICAYWFNRGQGVVARQIRSALDSLGHETFVLARPTRAGNIRPSFVDRSGVWAQPRVSEATAYEIQAEELLAWTREHELEVALFDQNYRFEAIEAVRRAGARTIGRFVWEQFSERDVEPAKRAFDVVYSLTACEQERYAGMGIESPRVRWGIHPELLQFAEAKQSDWRKLLYFYPAGFLSRRKPLSQVLKAFRRTQGDARLLIKGQVERETDLLDRGIRRDPRVEVRLEDLPMEAHMRLFASADACVAPSRWEGLGLHLYEAMALGLPVITNDRPPMNEVIRDGDNGLLVRSWRWGRAKSGIPAYLPSVRDLARAMQDAAEPGAIEELQMGAREARARLAWDRTLGDFAALIESVTNRPPDRAPRAT